MKKPLHTLLFNWLPLPAHVQFFERVKGFLTTAEEDVQTAVAPLMAEFDARLAEEVAVQGWIRKSVLTEQIAEADGTIDRLLVGINAIVQTGLHSSTPAIVESARRVHIMLKNFGRVASASYDKEEGDVKAILAQLTGSYAQDVTTLGMTTWVQQLQAALTVFENLLLQREDEQGEKPPYTAKEARKNMEDVYRRMMPIVEANATLGAYHFVAFIERLNHDIDRLNEEFHRAQKDLSLPGRTLIAPIGTQPYTGNPVTPLPEVYYTSSADNAEGEDSKKNKPTEKLFLGKDFTITYKNNIKVGQAQLTIHGKGDYKGQKSLQFYIAREPLPTDLVSG